LIFTRKRVNSCETRHHQGKANVFTTDVALGVLMAAPRSTISWDMVEPPSTLNFFKPET